MSAGSRIVRLRVGVGAVFWLGFTLLHVSDARTFAWSSSLLAFAALVLAPLVIVLVREPQETGVAANLLGLAQRLQLPAAILLLAAVWQQPGLLPAGLAAPWVVLTGLLALVGGLRLLARGVRPQWALCRDAGLVMFAVGGAWTLADRLGLHPLGFGTDIVQLTAVHFHYAGLVLPVVTGLVMREFSGSRVAAVAGLGVLAGVPLVAIGITAAQFGAGTTGELVAAAVLAPAAVSVAVLQLRLAAQDRWPMPARALWVVAGVSLLFGMTLALLYAARLPWPWLTIPWMRALHGTANALGFALCALLGWSLARRTSD